MGQASRKYNKSRSYIYFWQTCWDGRTESFACHSRRPHSHPKQHTGAELKLIRAMRYYNPNLGPIEFWRHLKRRGYNCRLECLFRIMRKQGSFWGEPPKTFPKNIIGGRLSHLPKHLLQIPLTDLPLLLHLLCPRDLLIPFIFRYFLPVLSPFQAVIQFLVFHLRHGFALLFR